jgi:hypothetical protein
MAGEAGLAEHSSLLVTECPHPDRESFLALVDDLIGELEQVLNDDEGPTSGEPGQMPQTVREMAGAPH